LVPGVLLSAEGAVPASATSNVSGSYTLSGLGAGPYTVTPSKSGEVNGSISGLDAARVAQHVAGLISLTPDQQVAGDATNNGSLSGLDAARIAQFAAGLTNPGVAGQWKFLPASRTYQNVAGAITGENYEAILVGEVTGNWVPAAGRPAGDESEEVIAPGLVSQGETGWSPFGTNDGAAVEVEIPHDFVAVRGDEFVVPVSIGDTTGRGILAYDLELEFDPGAVRLAAVDSEGTLSGGWTVIQNSETPGRLRLTAFGIEPLAGKGTLLNLRFETIANSKAASRLRWSMFELNEGQVPAKLDGGELTPAGESIWFSTPPRAGSVSLLLFGGRR
jgi:hypothetical protein